MSKELTPYSINDPKPNIKAGLTAMINEYNNLTDPKEKNRYMDSIMEWYMREKSLTMVNKSGMLDDNKYNDTRRYTSKF